MLKAGESRIGHYLFLEQIGSGAFASVWCARHEVTQMKVAIKVISRSTIPGEDITRLTRELSLLQQLHHPFLAEFFEFLEDESWFYYVMEFVEGGHIGRLIGSRTQLTEVQSRHYFAQLVSVLDYLHNEICVCHRDLKAENVMIDRNANIRLIDFGLSRQFSLTTPEMATSCGSPAYAAPEMIRQRPYTTTADIWSAGVLLFLMVTGHLPWDDGDVRKLVEKIVYTDTTFPPFLSSGLVNLLRRIFVKNPDQRIALAQINEHAWFAQSRYIFGLGEQVKSLQVAGREIDRAIVDRLASLGVECSCLEQHLVGGQHTEVTAMYRMLLRDKLTDAMTQLMMDPTDHDRASAAPVPIRPSHLRQTASGTDRFAPKRGGILRLGPMARTLQPRSSTPAAESGAGMWRRQRGFAAHPESVCRSPAPVPEDRAPLV
jgi:hypothetical protein